MITRFRDFLLRRLFPVGLAVLLMTPYVLHVTERPAEAASVLLNGWGCLSGCTQTINGVAYTVNDTGYPHQPPEYMDSKNWTSVVDWYGTPTYIYPDNTVDQKVPCTTPAGSPGEQLNGTSRWTNPDGVVQTQQTVGMCMGVPNNPPVVSLSCPAQQDLGTVVTCNVTASDPDPGDVLTTSWGGGSTVTGGPYYAAGPVTITASAKDKAGAFGQDSKTVMIVATANPAVSVSCSPATIPADGKTTTTCTASPTGGTAPYRFDWGSASKTFGPHTAAGSQPVSVTVTDANAMTGSGSGSYTVVAGTIAVSVTCSPSDVASGGNSTCTSTVSGGTAPYTYSWSTGGTSASTTLTNITATTTATVNVKDTAGATGSASGTVTVGGAPATACPAPNVLNPDGTCTPPCTPNPDIRDLSSYADPKLVRAGMGYTVVTRSWSGDRITNQSASAQWGDTKPYSGGKVTLYPPRGLSGKYKITSSADITQADGCGGTYGPDTFYSTVVIEVYQINVPDEDHTKGLPDDGMTVTNMPLADYLKVCLGDPEQWYCGIDSKLATVYLPELQAGETFYMADLGDSKWRKLVQRIDKALLDAGSAASGLFIP